MRRDLIFAKRSATDVVRVLLDATAIPVDRGGVGRYLDGLIPELVRLPCLDPIVVCHQHDSAQYRAGGAQVVEAPSWIGSRVQRFGWEQAGLPAVARTVRADVLHSPHYTMPLRPGLPTVVTLHDATFFSDPHLHSAVKRRFFRIATRIAIRRASALIVPSAATREELTRLVSQQAGRAVVAPHGVDTTVFHPPTADEVAKLRAELGLAEVPFVAFLGTIEPRKNVPNLIRGWAAAMAGRSEPPVLVLAGGKGWDDTVDSAVAQVPAGLRVVRPGYLPLEQLRALLGGADVVSYPALGEGFGLPVVEAMACGAAVLTTDRLSLPEVGGDAVEYTGVDAEAIGAGLSRLLDDPTRRRELSERAIRRAAGFSWARSARYHADTYQRAAERA